MFISIKKASEILGISPYLTRNVIKENDLYVIYNRHKYVPKASFLSFLQKINSTKRLKNMIIESKDRGSISAQKSRRKYDMSLLLPPITARGSIACSKSKGHKYYYIRRLPLTYDKNGNKIFYRNPKGGFKTRMEAEEEQERIIAKRTEMQNDTSYSISYYEYCRAFYMKKRDIKPQTQHEYLRIIENYFKPVFETIPILSLTKEMLQDFLNSGDKTRRMIKIAINQTIKSLYENDDIPKDISKGLTLPNINSKGETIHRKGQRPLPNRKEQETFLQALRETRKPLIYVVHFMICCGLRVGEALALTWKDIDLEHCCVSITKSYNKLPTGKYAMGSTKNKSSIRTAYFPSSLVPMLKQAFNNRPNNTIYFAPNAKGNLPITPNNFNRRYFVIVAKKAGLGHLKITSHIARHIYITRMIYAGANIKDIQKQVGHTDLRMIMSVYLHYIHEGAQTRIKENANSIVADLKEHGVM